VASSSAVALPKVRRSEIGIAAATASSNFAFFSASAASAACTPA
jgi:hypothetical protein